MCELNPAIKLERKKCQSTLKHDSTPLKLPEPKCAYHALPDMAFLASRHHIFNKRIPINFAPIWLYSPVCTTPHVSGNKFSQEGAGRHQEHKDHLIFHPSHPRNDAASETHPYVVNHKSLPTGALSRWIKGRLFKRKFGTALPILTGISIYHLPVVTALKFILICKYN